MRIGGRLCMVRYLIRVSSSSSELARELACTPAVYRRNGSAHVFQYGLQNAVTIRPKLKQRITYVQPDGRGIDVEDILIKNDGLSFNNAPAAALEKRLTIGLTELPREVGLHLRLSFPSCVD